MEKKMMCWSVKVLVLVLVVLGLTVSSVNADICSDALTKLLPCQPFLTASTADISVACCEGAQSVVQLASSKENFKAICVCLKQAITLPGINVDRAKQIPQLCNITTPVPLDPNIDCNKF